MERADELLRIELSASDNGSDPGVRITPNDGARILIYSHDTYGLGHLRRSLLIAQRLAELSEVSSILIATGSPLAQSFRLPPICDSVKLPALTKAANGDYRPHSLGIPLPELFAIRSGVMETVARSFSPDLILVDHAPVGAHGELWPLLRWVESQPHPPRLVLGLRDIIDAVERVEEEWERQGAWFAVDHMYDRILVYGDPTVLTTAQELGLAARHGSRLRHVGYLTREVERRPLAPLPNTRNLIVTVGGGGDGGPILDTFVDFLATLSPPVPFKSILVDGPLLPTQHHLALLERCHASGHDVEVVEFVEGIESLLNHAAGAVTMGGYNTVAEILASGIPALVVPRTNPRLEQSLRAERLSSVTQLEHCPAEEYGTHRLARFISRLGEAPEREYPPLLLNGLDQTVSEIHDVLVGSRTMAVGDLIA